VSERNPSFHRPTLLDICLYSVVASPLTIIYFKYFPTHSNVFPVALVVVLHFSVNGWWSYARRFCAVPRIVSEYFAVNAIYISIGLRNVTAERTVEALLLSTPTTKASCVRNVSTTCLISVPFVSVCRLIHLANIT